MGKREREARREGVQPGDLLTPEPSESEETARMVGVWREPGQGWRYAVVDLPRSVVERYAVEIGQPEIQPVTVGRALERLEAHIAKGVM